MPFEHWLSLFAICLLVAMSPGPSLAVITGITLRAGAGPGYGAALAHGVGVGCYGLLTIAGLAVLISRLPAALVIIQLLGAAYLAYLGVQALRQAAAPPRVFGQPGDPGHGWLSGFWIAFLNPKLAVFMLALFAQFLRPGAGLLEKGVMVVTVMATDAGWYTLAVTLVSRLARRTDLQARAPLIDRVFGVLLLALATSVALRALPDSW